MRSSALSAMCAVAAVGGLVSVSAAPAPQATWDMDSLARVVRPMRYRARLRIPMMLWNFPLPRDDQLVKMREDGSLRRAIEQLAARGLVPTVEMGWAWTLPGAMAMAKTLQEAGRPVNLLIPRVDLIEGTAYADCPIQVEGPDASWGNRVRKWPCLVLAKPERTAEWLREQVQPFRDAGIRVAGIWFDDECLPHPWNGCYEAQRSTEECRQQYPPGVLDSFASFRKWADPLKAELFTAAIRPLRAMFPGARVGCYGDLFSGTHRRFGLDAQMPSLYANTRDLAHAFGDRKPTQEEADRLYFTRLLAAASEASRAVVPGKLNIPYVSRFVPDDPDPSLQFPMSQGLYRELLRHILLRGADSLYLFNLGYPGSSVTPQFSFESVEDARAVMDELLAQRGFLQRGQPMTFEDPSTASVVWSGRRLGDRCLVRAVSPDGRRARVRIPAFEGVLVEVSAPPEGATYLISRTGNTRKVPATRLR